MRAGDLLAGRYRLVDLLSESRGAHFWRAWDTVLSRHVAVHLIADEDERSEMLMDAARRSATLFDPHLLRVLDADHIGGTCFVVNEWGEGLASTGCSLDGPLSPRRAAWLVAEVGSMIAHAHEKGIAHGRLVPENVLIDEAGSVKIIGFAVDAALNGIPRTAGSNRRRRPRRRPLRRRSPAGGPASPLGRTPGSAGARQPLRPRQVRAGVPRALDALCDEVLSPYPGPHDQGYDSAAGDRRRARGVRRRPDRRRRGRGGPPPGQHQPTDPADRRTAGAGPDEPPRLRGGPAARRRSIPTPSRQHTGADPAHPADGSDAAETGAGGQHRASSGAWPPGGAEAPPDDEGTHEDPRSTRP